MIKRICDRVGCQTPELNTMTLKVPSGINGATIERDFCLTCRDKVFKFFAEFLKGTRDVKDEQAAAEAGA